MSQTWSNEYLVNWNGQKSASSEFGEWKKLDQPSHTLRDFPWQTCKGCLVTADWRQHAHSNATWIPKPWAAVEMIHMIHGNHPRLSQIVQRIRYLKWNLVGGFNPSEKYARHLGWLFPIYGKKCSKAPTRNNPGSRKHFFSWLLTQIDPAKQWWHLSQAIPFWPYQPYTTVPYLLVN